MSTSIDIRNFNEKKDLAAFRMHFKDYCDELDAYMPSPDNNLDGLITDLLSNPDVYIRFIYADGEFAGLLLYGQRSNCHELCDFYIEDFYILPKFRRQHIGRNAIEQFIKDNPGRYCLRIIRNNEPAQIFWKQEWERIGARNITGSLIDYTPDGFDFYAYETEK